MQIDADFRKDVRKRPAFSGGATAVLNSQFSIAPLAKFEIKRAGSTPPSSLVWEIKPRSGDRE